MSNTTHTTPYNPLGHIKTPEQLEAYVQERMRAGRRTYGLRQPPSPCGR